MIRTLLLTFLSLLTLSPVSAEAPWSAVLVPEGEAAAAVAALEAQGIPALAWSNAVVEVSAFEGLETVPVGRLEEQLSPQDPRWDPWLKGLSGWFHGPTGWLRVWVPSDKASQAAQVVGRSEVSVPSAPVSATSAPLVTGWALVSLTLIYVVFVVVSGFRFGWPSWREPRRWLWVPVCLVLLTAGGLMTGRPPVAGTALPAGSAESWVQHRWFQETWPWGSRWDDYAPGTVWTFPSYEHRNGRLTEVSTSLTAGSDAWKSGLASTLDRRHVARIFGSFLP